MTEKLGGRLPVKMSAVARCSRCKSIVEVVDVVASVDADGTLYSIAIDSAVVLAHWRRSPGCRRTKLLLGRISPEAA